MDGQKTKSREVRFVYKCKMREISGGKGVIWLYKDLLHQAGVMWT